MPIFATITPNDMLQNCDTLLLLIICSLLYWATYFWSLYMYLAVLASETRITVVSSLAAKAFSKEIFVFPFACEICHSSIFSRFDSFACASHVHCITKVITLNHYYRRWPEVKVKLQLVIFLCISLTVSWFMC